MKKILLHVGTHKTGSTTIQKTLFKNRNRLMECGILYPSSIGFNHNELRSVFMSNPWSWGPNRRKGLTKQQVIDNNERTLHLITEEIESSSCSCVIVSAEHLSVLGPQAINTVKRWLEPLGEVQVVYFVRHIETWLASHLQHNARLGLIGSPKGYEAARKRLYDHPLMWEKAFGGEHFTLLLFENAVTNGLTNTLLSVGASPIWMH